MSAATVARKPIVYIAGAAAALAVALILIVTLSSPSASKTVNGTYDLDAGYATGGYCVGAGDYADVYDGAPVWVFDEPGHPLASSKLVLEGQSGTACQFAFSVSSPDEPVWVQVGTQAKVRVTDGVMVLRSGPPRQP
ncbi:hypothetical protein ACIOD2_32470 [Amycolatopsis sp. NPDC088138]|uniref:hypothetical protein n=1 Tax=Amycolatopsis sp. NPDC088138 TaxID=3363938 RepID=UPI003811F287